jgi:hypothetical protein
MRLVAEQLGYDDVYDFSRLFRKVVGMAPSHYRVASGLSQRFAGAANSPIFPVFGPNALVRHWPPGLGLYESPLFSSQVRPTPLLGFAALNHNLRGHVPPALTCLGAFLSVPLPLRDAGIRHECR